MAKMKSKLPDRRKAAQAIEDMAADLQARGLTLCSVFPPLFPETEWQVTFVQGDGNMIPVAGATLDDCYLAAMNYPDTPPPF